MTTKNKLSVSRKKIKKVKGYVWDNRGHWQFVLPEAPTYFFRRDAKVKLYDATLHIEL